MSSSTSSGVINFDKPPGCTSHDVVDFVRGLLGRDVRVGHGGTLDPPASGVLPILVGSATRLAEYFTGEDKRYRVHALFDRVTTTGDLEGEVTARHEPAAPPERPALDKACAAFTGRIRQTPPMYSAVRVGGVRLHELARRGEVVERPEREVVVLGIEVHEYAWPRASFSVRCSSGTYVRTLVEDLGRSLAVGGTVERLRREAVGLLEAAAAVGPLAVAGAFVRGEFERLLEPWARLFSGIARAVLTPAGLARVRNGGPLTDDLLVACPDGAWERVAVFTQEGALAAVYRRQQGGLVAEKVLLGG